MSQQILYASVLVSALVGAGAAALKAAVWFWHTMRQLARLADDLTGEPARPGHPARLGVLDRLAAIETRLDRLDDLEARMTALEAQMRPNGGASLRDAVDRLGPAQETAVPQS